MNKHRFLKWLQAGVAEMVNDKPAVIHRFVLYSGDGVSGPFSYSWAGSWQGRVDTLGREVWFRVRGPASTDVMKRSYSVLLPFSPTYPQHPEPDDKLELYDGGGNLMGIFRVNYSVPFEIDGTVWKIDVTVEEMQP